MVPPGVSGEDGEEEESPYDGAAILLDDSCPATAAVKHDGHVVGRAEAHNFTPWVTNVPKVSLAMGTRSFIK